jgi:hypothetical protein
MLSLLFSIALGAQTIDTHTLPVNRVERIAQEVIGKMHDELQTQPTLWVTSRPEQTPLGALAHSAQRCTLVINTNKGAWAQWSRFLSGNNTALWDGIIAASVAHEIGHCMNEAHQFTNEYQIQAESMRALGGSSEKKTGDTATVFKQELFADAVAVIYAREHQQSIANDVIKCMLDSRAKFGEYDPAHNTSRELRALIKAGGARKQGENIGEAASRLLSRN